MKPVISVKCWVPLFTSGNIGAEEGGGKADEVEGMTAVKSIEQVASPVNDGTSSSSSSAFEPAAIPGMRGTLPVNSIVCPLCSSSSCSSSCTRSNRPRAVPASEKDRRLFCISLVSGPESWMASADATRGEGAGRGAAIEASPSGDGVVRNSVPFSYVAVCWMPNDTRLLPPAAALLTRCFLVALPPSVTSVTGESPDLTCDSLMSSTCGKVEESTKVRSGGQKTFKTDRLLSFLAG